MAKDCENFNIKKPFGKKKIKHSWVLLVITICYDASWWAPQSPLRQPCKEIMTISRSYFSTCFSLILNAINDLMALKLRGYSLCAQNVSLGKI